MNPVGGVQPVWGRFSALSRIPPLSAGFILLTLGLALHSRNYAHSFVTHVPAPYNAAAILAQCSAISAKIAPAPDFANRRLVSDRFVQGTGVVLIKNATLWTGDEIIEGGNLLLANGLIKHVGGPLSVQQLASLGYNDIDIRKLDAVGGWITPA